MSEEINKLIPELAEWNNGDGIDIDAWAQCVGNFEHAIAYAELFWPEFELYDGCAFFAGIDKRNYQDWMKSTNGDKTSVQAVMNHTHIVDLFPNVKEEPTREQVVHLGRKLKDMWETKLKRDFPGQEITVSFPEDESEDLLSYEITFFI
ncbi:MAG: hypothetical protein K8S55_09695 [Phycisphaerae bacterium]|nr:hypothetical protein [Phycisphaerae bacterium]